MPSFHSQVAFVLRAVATGFCSVTTLNVLTGVFGGRTGFVEAVSSLTISIGVTALAFLIAHRLPRRDSRATAQGDSGARAI